LRSPNVGIKFTVPEYPGQTFRADPGSKYKRDGGQEYNVRDVTNLKPGQYFVKGQVTRFYQERDGTLRASNPTKSKTKWHNDTPAEEWLYWKPFADAWQAEKEARKLRAIEKRKQSKRIMVMRNGKKTFVERSQARPSEIEAYERGDKLE
jgi:hypothetical protein